MNGFWFNDEQQAIRDAVLRLCERFDAEYWRRTDETGEFPQAFVDAMCEAGWLGAAMPVEPCATVPAVIAAPVNSGLAVTRAPAPRGGISRARRDTSWSRNISPTPSP